MSFAIAQSITHSHMASKKAVSLSYISQRSASRARTSGFLLAGRKKRASHPSTYFRMMSLAHSAFIKKCVTMQTYMLIVCIIGHGLCFGLLLSNSCSKTSSPSSPPHFLTKSKPDACELPPQAMQGVDANGRFRTTLTFHTT